MFHNLVDIVNIIIPIENTSKQYSLIMVFLWFVVFFSPYDTRVLIKTFLKNAAEIIIFPQVFNEESRNENTL